MKHRPAETVMLSSDYLNGLEDGRACQLTALLIGLFSGCVATVCVLWLLGRM
ncbi:MAG: hypothetical protein ACYTFN_14240 [Planctomycetota bacterium]|jgi:hypothetical protein